MSEFILCPFHVELKRVGQGHRAHELNQLHCNSCYTKGFLFDTTHAFETCQDLSCDHKTMTLTGYGHTSCFG